MKINAKITKSLKDELKRQREHIELIASENFASKEVMELTGSVFTNKYAEGYPGKRYYGGCENVDIVEQLAIDTLKEIFKVDHANVQPHSGSQANAAVYKALDIKPGDTILGMDLAAGGHLTHGYKMNFSGDLYKSISYGVDKKTGRIDMNEVAKLAKKHKPKVIIVGASAYSRKLNFKKFSEIAKKNKAYLWADIAHIAGLIAGGQHPSPAKYCDVITSTTHKTLRGPRGGIIMSKKELAKRVDFSIFPYFQGGPLENIIAAKAQCFIEAKSPAFKKYAKQVVSNSKAFAAKLKSLKVKVVTGGTDNHLFTFNVKDTWGITGKEAEKILHSVNITTNKNMIPFDSESPFKTSGIRVGTPAMTTRGYKEKEFRLVANLIYQALENRNDQKKLKVIKNKVIALNRKFPLYKGMK